MLWSSFAAVSQSLSSLFFRAYLSFVWINSHQSWLVLSPMCCVVTLILVSSPVRSFLSGLRAVLSVERLQNSQSLTSNSALSTLGLSAEAADFSGEDAAELQAELEDGSSILLSLLTSMRSCDTFLFLGGSVDSSSPGMELSFFLNQINSFSRKKFEFS